MHRPSKSANVFATHSQNLSYRIADSVYFTMQHQLIATGKQCKTPQL